MYIVLILFNCIYKYLFEFFNKSLLLNLQMNRKDSILKSVRERTDTEGKEDVGK